jgi:uridine kinase
MKNKNIILVTGRSASGKSTFLRVLTELIEPSILIADYNFFGSAIVKDDLENMGRGHMHPESHPKSLGITQTKDGGHIHSPERESEGPFPVIATENSIVTQTYSSFYEELVNTKTDSYLIAEMGGAKNAHPKDSPLAKMDYSYETIAKNLSNGTYNSDALDKILICIHITLSDEIRKKRLNTRPDINEDVLTLMEIDDFENGFSNLLQKKDIPIISISNDKAMSEKEIREKLKTILVEHQIEIN